MTALGQVSIHSLRPTLLYLRRNGTSFRLHSRLLEILRPPSIDSSINVTVPLLQGELDQELREGLRRSLKKHLFGWSDFLSLRLRLAVADFCWVGYVYPISPHPEWSIAI
jgi:general transcription factor 3C protein 4